VRVALGAQAGDVMAMVVRRSVWLALGGVVPGVVLAYVAGRSMEALLAGLEPFDAPTFAAAVVLALVMTVAGSLVPARRALSVDPIVAIRAE
jgi:ABC-type antimicrobial peptide transport system permease subunit